MRLQVVVDSSGQVIATANREPQQLPDGSTIEVFALPMEGRTIHEIDVPENLVAIEDVDEFHRKVGELVQQA